MMAIGGGFDEAGEARLYTLGILNPNTYQSIGKYYKAENDDTVLWEILANDTIEYKIVKKSPMIPYK
jgi:hypothetical protein